MSSKFKQLWRASMPPSIQSFDYHISEIKHRLEALELVVKDHRRLEAVASGVKQDLVLGVLRSLRPMKAKGVEKKRIGSSGDGGYVMLDRLSPNLKALSFGIDINDDWDLAVAEAGLKVDQFDHSVAAAPSSHQNLRFFRKMIGDADSETVVSLSTLLKSNPGDILLKADIEGAEWDMFRGTQTDELARCQQICCEFHDLGKLSYMSFATAALDVFEKLGKTHRVIHVHANNCMPLVNIENIAIPDVIEITFASRAHFEFEETDETFPGPLDAPNYAGTPDIQLGCFKFAAPVPPKSP